MLTKICVHRSDKWVAAQRLARGENVANYVECEVAVEGLSETARRVLLAAGFRQYREKYAIFGYDSDFAFCRYNTLNGCGYGYDCPIVDSDAPTPVEIDAAILAMAARVDEKRRHAESEKAAAEERRRAEREAAEEKSRKLAEARELLKEEVGATKVKLQKMTEDRRILASFIVNIPQDALRGGLKSYAVEENTIEECRKEIEDASPYTVFEDK